jgi:hypothetical protein
VDVDEVEDSREGEGQDTVGSWKTTRDSPGWKPGCPGSEIRGVGISEMWGCIGQ